MTIFAMSSQLLLADAVLLLHLCIAAFVVGGLPMIVAGNLAHWRWVNGWWFRIGHGAAIAIVVAESWLGMTCPLTTLESWLRASAGAAPYSRSFVAHWVSRMLFYEVPEWVFVAAYTVFALLVAVVWWVYPPRTGVPDGGRVQRGPDLPTHSRRPP